MDSWKQVHHPNWMIPEFPLLLAKDLKNKRCHPLQQKAENGQLYNLYSFYFKNLFACDKIECHTTYENEL